MSVSKNDIVLFHGNCIDGLCSAFQHFHATWKQSDANDLSELHQEIGKNYIGLGHDFKRWTPEEFVNYVEQQSGKSLSDIDNMHILDITISNEQFEHLIQNYPNMKFTVIDHHISEQNALEEIANKYPERFNVLFDTRISAAALSNLYFSHHEMNLTDTKQHLQNADKQRLLNDVPDFIKLVHLRDTFEMKSIPDPDERYHVEAMSLWIGNNLRGNNLTQLFDFRLDLVKNQYTSENMVEIIDKAHARYSMHNEVIQNILAPNMRIPVAFVLADGNVVHGYQGNALPQHASDAGYAMCRLDEDHPFSAFQTYRTQTDGSLEASISFRSNYEMVDGEPQGFNALAIAKTLGGGGHPAACAITIGARDTLTSIFDKHNEKIFLEMLYDNIFTLAEQQKPTQFEDVLSEQDYIVPKSVYTEFLTNLASNNVKSINDVVQDLAERTIKGEFKKDMNNFNLLDDEYRSFRFMEKAEHIQQTLTNIVHAQYEASENRPAKNGLSHY